MEIYSDIQKITHTQINALKITIHDTKHTKNTKIHFQKPNKSKKHFETRHNSKQIFYYVLNFHNSYFVPKILKNPNRLEQNGQYENCSHFWDVFVKIRKMFKHTFNLCPHIKLNTTNSNTIFKVTICYKKYPQHANILSIVCKLLENPKSQKSKLYFILCINCIIHKL